VHVDQTTCTADTPCTWYELGRPCPDDGTVCQSGVCSNPAGSGSGGGSGSGSTGAGCACSNGGVCYEQVGGTAQQGGTGPEVQCTTPAAGDGDPCGRIAGQGVCSDSTQVTGLCICDNGIR
jgi:hypothetical protein